MWLTNGIEVNRNKKEEQEGRNSAEDPPYARSGSRDRPRPGCSHTLGVGGGHRSVTIGNYPLAKILKSMTIGNSHLAEIFHLTLETRDR